MRDFRGNDVLRFDSQFALLEIGGVGNEGDIRVRNNADAVTIHLDGNTGDISLANGDVAEEFVPEHDGRARVQVARRSGAVVMTGSATVSDDGISFELASAVTPHMPPTKVAGRYGGRQDKLVLDRLLMARGLTPQQRSLIRAPTLQIEPLSASRDPT